MLELLKDKTYIRYWLAVVVSFVGDAMTRVTLIYVAADLTHNPGVIALVALAQLLPSGLLGAFVGPLADRIAPRGLLVGSDLFRSVIVLAMIPFLDSIAMLVVLILLQGVGKAVFETARISSVPKIVGRPDRIPKAIALFQSTNWSVNLIGPAVGGVLIGFGDLSAVLVIDAVTYVLSALLLASMVVLREVPIAAGREPYWQSLRTGVRGVLAVPSLRLLLAITVPVTVVFGLFTTNFNAQLLTVFDLSGFEFGLASALLAGGSIVGALVGPALIKRYGSGSSLLLVTVGLFGLGLVALAPTQWLWAQLGLGIVCVWCVLTGVTSGLFQVPIANTLLSDLPEEFRGRGVGLLNTISINFTVLGIAIGGLIATAFGVASSIIVSGVLLIIFAAVCLVPALRAAPPRDVAERADVS